MKMNENITVAVRIRPPLINFSCDGAFPHRSLSGFTVQQRSASLPPLAAVAAEEPHVLQNAHPLIVAESANGKNAVIQVHQRSGASAEFAFDLVFVPVRGKTCTCAAEIPSAAATSASTANSTGAESSSPEAPRRTLDAASSLSKGYAATTPQCCCSSNEKVSGGCLEPDSQAIVFERIAQPLCDAFLEGFSATILAYGQTGSGKTYTIIGPQDNGLNIHSERGLLPRALHYLYTRLPPVGNGRSPTTESGTESAFNRKSDEPESICDQVEKNLRAAKSALGTSVAAGPASVPVVSAVDSTGSSNNRLKSFSAESSTDPTILNWKMEIQFVEIYQEQIYDLLAVESSPRGTASPRKNNVQTSTMLKHNCAAPSSKSSSVCTLFASTSSQVPNGHSATASTAGISSSATTSQPAAPVACASALKIRFDPRRRAAYVVGARRVRVDSEAAAMQVFAQGIKNRRTAETRQNHLSSRSHAIFSIHLQLERQTTLIKNGSRCVDVDATTGKLNKDTGKRADGCRKISSAQLHIVDLAGSERQRNTCASGDRLREAGKINYSLSVLSHVIRELVERNANSSNSEVTGEGGRGIGNSTATKNIFTHIPYRDSKLTFLLINALGGSSKVAFIATLSPLQRHLGETLSTLQFAAMSKRMRNKVVLHEEKVWDKASIEEMVRMNAKQDEELKRLRTLLDRKNAEEDAAGSAGSEATFLSTYEQENLCSSENAAATAAAVDVEQRVLLLEHALVQAHELHRRELQAAQKMAAALHKASLCLQDCKQRHADGQCLEEACKTVDRERDADLPSFSGSVGYAAMGLIAESQRERQPYEKDPLTYLAMQKHIHLLTALVSLLLKHLKYRQELDSLRQQQNVEKKVSERRGHIKRSIVVTTCKPAIHNEVMRCKLRMYIAKISSGQNLNQVNDFLVRQQLLIEYLESLIVDAETSDACIVCNEESTGPIASANMSTSSEKKKNGRMEDSLHDTRYGEPSSMMKTGSAKEFESATVTTEVDTRVLWKNDALIRIKDPGQFMVPIVASFNWSDDHGAKLKGKETAGIQPERSFNFQNANGSYNHLTAAIHEKMQRSVVKAAPDEQEREGRLAPDSSSTASKAQVLSACIELRNPHSFVHKHFIENQRPLQPPPKLIHDSDETNFANPNDMLRTIFRFAEASQRLESLLHKKSRIILCKPNEGRDVDVAGEKRDGKNCEIGVVAVQRKLQAYNALLGELDFFEYNWRAAESKGKTGYACSYMGENDCVDLRMLRPTQFVSGERRKPQICVCCNTDKPERSGAEVKVEASIPSTIVDIETTSTMTAHTVPLQEDVEDGKSVPNANGKSWCSATFIRDVADTLIDWKPSPRISIHPGVIKWTRLPISVSTSSETRFWKKKLANIPDKSNKTPTSNIEGSRSKTGLFGVKSVAYYSRNQFTPLHEFCGNAVEGKKTNLQSEEGAVNGCGVNQSLIDELRKAREKNSLLETQISMLHRKLLEQGTTRVQVPRNISPNSAQHHQLNPSLLEFWRASSSNLERIHTLPFLLPLTAVFNGKDTVRGRFIMAVQQSQGGCNTHIEKGAILNILRAANTCESGSMPKIAESCHLSCFDELSTFLEGVPLTQVKKVSRVINYGQKKNPAFLNENGIPRSELTSELLSKEKQQGEQALSFSIYVYRVYFKGGVLIWTNSRKRTFKTKWVTVAVDEDALHRQGINCPEACDRLLLAVLKRSWELSARTTKSIKTSDRAQERCNEAKQLTHVSETGFNGESAHPSLI